MKEFGTIGVGIVGGGFMGAVHARAAAAAGASIRGLVSNGAASSERAAAALGVERIYPTLSDMLSDDSVDVVHLCTPNSVHFEQATQVLLAGKSVVCEKPLATTIADADSLVSLAQERTATIPFAYRFHPMVREARARIARGELGTLCTIGGSYLQDWLARPSADNWRVDPNAGGRSRAFADIGSHLVDQVEFVTGDRITQLAAVKRTFIPTRSGVAVTTEDAVALVIRTQSGAVGTLMVSQVGLGHKNGLRWEFSGSRSTMAFDQESPESLWIGGSEYNSTLQRDPNFLSEDAKRFSFLPAGHPQGLQDAFNAFAADTYAAVRGAEPSGLPRFEDGRRAVLLTLAAMRAAEGDGWVDVEEAS